MGDRRDVMRQCRAPGARWRRSIAAAALMAALGPISAPAIAAESEAQARQIDAKTRDIVENIYLRKVETRDGKLLVFESGTNMVVHCMDPQELFPYKRPQMEKVFDAFETMLKQKIERNRAAPPLSPA